MPSVQKSVMYRLVYFFYGQYAPWSLATDNVEMHGLPAYPIGQAHLYPCAILYRCTVVITFAKVTLFIMHGAFYINLRR
ncbi:hypothetical protein ALO35_200019 [Pseudomonas amygdali pv. lachrymans]|uniref:Uncharacterized protein n=1 Tax=Pseudomonas amygdali pv. lachrymans TaxID=53707 RepID=A0A0P9S315_PSEAV|nr:hypothetical protein ALO35_200019 [Pseudomonas amygdali pv. lachrymans]KPY77878.1 hypothetical protein ALO60_200180 [Pseudomonas amygdali pv. tabaci]